MEAAAPAQQSLQAELADYRRQLEAVGKEAVSLVDALSDEAFNWRPELGRWSVSECLEHLNATGRVYLDKLPAHIEASQAKGPFGDHAPKRGWLGGLFIWILEPPVKRMKAKAPAQFRPGGGLSLTQVMAERVELHRNLDECLRKANGLDLWRVKMPLPTIPQLRLSLGEIFGVLLSHERRHLWQAHQVRKDPNFPV